MWLLCVICGWHRAPQLGNAWETQTKGGHAWESNVLACKREGRNTACACCMENQKKTAHAVGLRGRNCARMAANRPLSLLWVALGFGLGLLLAPILAKKLSFNWAYMGLGPIKDKITRNKNTINKSSNNINNNK